MDIQKGVTKDDLLNEYRSQVKKLKDKQEREGHLNRDEKRNLLWKSKRLETLES